MGIKPKVIVAPSAMAEFAQRAATFQNAFALSPAMETFVKQSQDFQSKLKAAFDKSGFVKLAKQIKNTFAKAKDFFQQKLFKFLPIALPLFEIPRVSIKPSSGKSLQLPNSYRSHYPPLYSVIV
jgi:hypothetical protein